PRRRKVTCRLVVVERGSDSVSGVLPRGSCSSSRKTSAPDGVVTTCTVTLVGTGGAATGAGAGAAVVGGSGSTTTSGLRSGRAPTSHTSATPASVLPTHIARRHQRQRLSTPTVMSPCSGTSVAASDDIRTIDEFDGSSGKRSRDSAASRSDPHLSECTTSS